MARPTIKTTCEMSADNKRQLIRSISTLDGWYEVTIQPRKSNRSQQQNRYYWACICTVFADYLNHQDYEITTPEGAHSILKARYLAVDVPNPLTGEVMQRRVRSTTELSTVEFADYCERCRAWLADFFDIVVPDPDPAWREQPRKHLTPAD